MPRHLLVALLLALLVATPAAAVNPASKKERIDQKIETLNDKIAAARTREQQLHSQIAHVNAKIRALESEVGGVSNDLELLERDLALQQEKLNRITELWRLQTRKLNFLERQHAQAVDRLSDRLVAIYESGNVTTVDVLLSSASFSELVSRLDFVRELAAQDRRIADSVGHAKDEMAVQQGRTTVTRRKISVVTRTVAVRAAQTRLVRDRLVARERTLAGAKSQKQATLAAVEESKQDYLNEVNALLAVSAQLASRIQSSQSGSQPVQPSSSGFIWPVSGPVTSGFGWRWGRMHEGIDIAVPSGTPVHASASGRVIYGGWLGGYGNLVVIDHGGGIATAYGHNTSIVAGTGSGVSQGQVVAYSGSTGHSTGPHVHFEVRVNGSAVDPMGYLG
ncbi:MAG TPA: peptidoglycan DD-metalloendopeptidase family protein [Gaiellaceae bacterium]|nr:peptidoglycan DD-metalloendopeptidase family protein [Gaiellaceae bacterium]